jgi:hypothetical protein
MKTHHPTKPRQVQLYRFRFCWQCWRDTSHRITPAGLECEECGRVTVLEAGHTEEMHGADGWLMTWDLDATPAYVKFFCPDGILNNTLSGGITPQKLEREARRFREQHGDLEAGPGLVQERMVL